MQPPKYDISPAFRALLLLMVKHSGHSEQEKAQLEAIFKK